jgi:hypothetical protein
MSIWRTFYKIFQFFQMYVLQYKSSNNESTFMQTTRHARNASP